MEIKRRSSPRTRETEVNQARPWPHLFGVNNAFRVGQVFFLAKRDHISRPKGNDQRRDGVECGLVMKHRAVRAREFHFHAKPSHGGTDQHLYAGVRKLDFVDLQPAIRAIRRPKRDLTPCRETREDPK